MALDIGYSKAGINNLRPSSGSYHLSALIHYKDLLTPYVLEPKLKMYEDLYAANLAEAEGFKPNDDLKAKREIAVKKLKSQAVKVDKVSQKSNKVESKKRPAWDSSVSSTASTSTERRAGSHPAKQEASFHMRTPSMLSWVIQMTGSVSEKYWIIDTKIQETHGHLHCKRL